jgi:hypothetical protein
VLMKGLEEGKTQNGKTILYNISEIHVTTKAI